MRASESSLPKPCFPMITNTNFSQPLCPMLPTPPTPLRVFPQMAHFPLVVLTLSQKLWGEHWISWEPREEEFLEELVQSPVSEDKEDTDLVPGKAGRTAGTGNSTGRGWGALVCSGTFR